MKTKASLQKKKVKWQTPRKANWEKREKTQFINTRNGTGGITIDPMDIKRINKGILWLTLYHKFDNLD